jgi:integrase
VTQLEERIAAGSGWQDNDYVFATEEGRGLDARNVWRVHQRMLATAGLPRVRIHDLRHTCATLMLEQGADLRVLMEVLGHSQISLTANTYAHVLPTLTRQAADRMGAALATPA